ncbi:D-alanyl-lipoteichoic acid biosynthesis protein DltD [Clostridium butyricum]|uniref:D-alanyl-lipoteichoic acid biosynthesis protein DltD n=1 Tax=Clostridium butyricum TaxID=1492 RepID=UPI003D3519B7
MIIIYDIIIFGTGSTAEHFCENLNKDVNIICYLDNDNLKWNKEFKNKLILKPDEVKNITYDYVIIASQYNNDIFSQLIELNVRENKIFEYLAFINDLYNPFEYRMKIFEKNIMGYESFITGISYFVSGIDGDILKGKGMNFSFDSQDLYYDYNIAKYILENYENKFKYTIIGLNYYSFQYDLSLSSMKDNIRLYYPILKKSHNYKISNDDYSRLIINKNIADSLLIINSGEYVLKNRLIPLSKQTEELGMLGIKQAELDCNKNYPKTVVENKKIFRKYLDLLKEHNIKPIIVICPTSKYYYKNFSKRIKNEFFEIMDEMKKKYDFQYIDYFESKLFDDSMFYDVSHLTFEGGKVFTEILNKEIKV